MNQRLSAQQIYYSGLLNLDAKMNLYASKSGLKNYLDGSKNFLLDYLKMVEFNKQLAKEEEMLLGSFIKEIDEKAVQAGEGEDRRIKQAQQIANKIKSKQGEIGTIVKELQALTGALSINTTKNGKQINIKHDIRGQIWLLQQQILDSQQTIAEIIFRYQLKQSDANDQRLKADLAQVDLIAAQDRKRDIQKEIKAKTQNLKKKQFLEEDNELLGKIRQKFNKIERKNVQNELKDLQQEQNINIKNIKKIKSIYQKEEREYSALKRELTVIQSELTSIRRAVKDINDNLSKKTERSIEIQSKVYALKLELGDLQYKYSLKVQQRNEYHQSQVNYASLKTLLLNKQKIVVGLYDSYCTIQKDEAQQLDQVQDEIEIYKSELKVIDKDIGSEHQNIQNIRKVIQKNVNVERAESINLSVSFIRNKLHREEVKKL